MNDLRDLYQEVILDHSKRPKNFGEPAVVTHRSRGNNPLCGDKVEVFLEVRDGVVNHLAFEGAGCAISTASASIMTQALEGRTVEEALSLFSSFHEMLTGDPSVAAEPAAALGKLAVFAGVREYPVRVKCATLAWHTLAAALESGAAEPAREPVTTE